MASSDAKPFPLKNQAFRITFPIFDSTGSLVTGAAGLDSEASLDGGTFADCTNEATEIATNSGMYYLDLAQAEMNADTVAIIVKTSTSGAKTTPIVLYPAESTDIPVNVTAISGYTTAADNLEAATDGGTYNVGGGAVVAASVTGAVGSVTGAVGSVTGAVGSVTGNVGGNVTGSVGSLAAQAKADVNAEVDTALNTAIPGSPTADSINERVATMDGLLLGTVAAGTHVAQSGDAYARLGAPAGASVSADIAALPTDADVQTAAAAALTAYDPPTNAEMNARTLVAASYFDPAADVVAHVTLVDTTTTNTDMVAAAPSAASVADAVWDEAIAGHAGVGSTGAALAAASSAGDPWATALPGAYGAGTAGKLIGDNVNAPIATVQTSVNDVPTVAEFEARTLPSADYTIVSDLGTVQTGDAFARLGAPAGASVSADVAAVKADSGAILADTGTDGVVVAAASKTGYGLASDGLDSVSITAPAGVASNFREMVVQTWRRLFKKTTMTATELKTLADDGSTVLTTQTLSDDSTTQVQGAAT